MKGLTPALALVLCAGPSHAFQWTPIFDGQLLLGQVFQDGKASSWQGNVKAQFTPAVKFSPALTALPTYAATYQGTRSATELAGGSILFQDSQTHLINFKGIYAYNNLKIKPTASYRWEFLRETRQVEWGKGLFDYRKPAVGLEADYSFSPQVKVDAVFDFYAIDFPNYRSLESQAGPGLGREQAQARTLNTRNYSATMGGNFPLPFEGGAGRLTLNVTNRHYPEQHIVDNTGGLSGKLRKDVIRAVAGTFYYGRAFSPVVTGIFSCALGHTRYDSNQNNYDAELNLFNSGFYSYEERSIQPSLTAKFGGKKVEVAVSYLRIERDYLGRLAQNAAGSYLSERTSLTQDSFLFDLSIPIARGFKLIAHSALTDSASTMLYEKNFRYNYMLASHLVGFSYSY